MNVLVSTSIVACTCEKTKKLSRIEDAKLSRIEDAMCLCFAVLCCVVLLFSHGAI
jgi:hypothetical protein